VARVIGVSAKPTKQGASKADGWPPRLLLQRDIDLSACPVAKLNLLRPRLLEGPGTLP
jgi:hypothetical protein